MGGANNDSNQPNEKIMVISTIICNVMSSAAGAECGAFFYHSKELEALRATLKEMGYPQQATEIIIDNSMAYGSMIVTIKLKRTKAMDMCFIRYVIK